MKRAIFWVACLVAVALIIMHRTNETQVQENRDRFVAFYDQIDYEFEVFMDKWFLENIFFYDIIQFDNFDAEAYTLSLEELADQLIIYTNNVEQLKSIISDDYVTKYSRQITTSAGSIIKKLNSYSQAKSINSSHTNIITTYKDTFLFMENIRDDLLTLSKNRKRINYYIDKYRKYELKPILYDNLKSLGRKNELRILYTYLYLACYMSSYDDYTGLHTNPKVPWFIELNDGAHIVYELNVDILKSVRSFAYDFVAMDSLVRALDNDISMYARLIEKVLDGLDNYIRTREKLPDDYYRNYTFLQDQAIRIERNEIIFYDFDYNDTIYTDLKKAYFRIKFINDHSLLNRLLFDKESLPDNYQEESLITLD